MAVNVLVLLYDGKSYFSSSSIFSLGNHTSEILIFPHFSGLASDRAYLVFLVIVDFVSSAIH